MKLKALFTTLLMALCLTALPAAAGGLGDIRMNARFLTDRMAFELHLNPMQYNDLFEVNFDFFSNIDRYMYDGVYDDPRAMDSYYRYLDERNDDIRWILSNVEYGRFMALDYFFRPVYLVGSNCMLRIYARYPNRDYFYYARPTHYYTYRGIHGRAHCGGVSYYRRHFDRRYRHPVYSGAYQCRPDFRRHDFMPPRGNRRPSGGPGYRFEPVPVNRPSRPGNVRPPYDRPSRPESNRPSYNRPSRPEGNRPQGNRPQHDRPSRPESNRPQMSRPSRPESNRPSYNRPSRPESNRPQMNRPSRPNGSESRRPGRVERRNNDRSSQQTDRRGLRNI